MPSSLLRAGIAALFDRSRGAVAAITGAGGPGAADDDAVTGPLAPSWLVHGGWASPDAFTDVRRLLFYAAACVMLLVLVAVTCPTDLSFRSHLTELAFRRHLAHIRSSDEPETDARNSSTPPNGVSASASGGNHTGSDTPPIAPFRFANHVAISLRTPSLCYQSYFFFAIALSAAPRPPAYLSDPVPSKAAKNAGPPPPEPALVYLGVLGHWFMLGQVPALLQWAWRLVRIGRRDKARKKSSALDRPGVLEMRAVLPNKDETTAPTSTRPSALVPKLLFKNDSYKDLTDLLPLHSGSSILPQGGSLVPEPRSRRGSIVNLIATPPTPPTLEGGAPAIEVSSPVLTALKAELATAQSVLAELQAQLTTHDEAVAASQGHLQSTLDELRQRRKEDDAERQDLKSKAKTLDDQKRQAEGARRESEKRLKTVESIRDGIQAKITTALGEIEELKENMELSRHNITIVHQEAARHLVETRQAVDDKTTELGVIEAEVVEAEQVNETLCQRVKDAEDKLKSAEIAAVEARKMAPEEEMMLMAAAYEAVASETYLHGQRQNQADSQWASQAAAYMAEAGFPHLDQSYTARPTQSAASGYGHLARAHPNNASYRSLVEKNISATAADKKLADVSGFEDFGPGASRSLARPTTPSLQTDDIDDQGSPSGPMSASFPDSWLPQGLVRSLEGDVTPLEGASEVAPSDDEGLYASHTIMHEDAVADDSGSDSDLGSPHWPTSAREHFDEYAVPGPRSRRVTPTSRLLPNGQPAMSGSASTLPGMNSTSTSNAANSAAASSMAAASSRRWFSTSPSSENVSSSFNLFSTGGMPGGLGSSDSLPLGFESPFAPSASEKRALKWPLLGKARWGGGGTNGNAANGLDEITQSLKEDQQLSTSPSLSLMGFGSSPPATAAQTSLSAEELFNRVPADSAPTQHASLAPGRSPWLSARPFGYGNNNTNNSNANGHGLGHGSQNQASHAHHTRVSMDEEAGLAGMSGADMARPPPERKPSFRFFSLRKGA